MRTPVLYQSVPWWGAAAAAATISRVAEAAHSDSHEQSAPKPVQDEPVDSRADIAPEPVPQAVTTPRPEDIASAAPLVADDLTLIRGIDSDIAAALKGAGISRYAQIVKWTDAEVRQVNEAFGARRVSRENWIEQAQILANGGETLYTRMRNGSRVRLAPVAAGAAAAARPRVERPSSAAPRAPVVTAQAEPHPVAPTSDAAAGDGSRPGSAGVSPEVAATTNSPTQEADPAAAEDTIDPAAAVAAPAGATDVGLVGDKDRAEENEAATGGTVAELTDAGDATDQSLGGDDLTLLSGIDETAAAILSERGVSTYSQIASWSADDVSSVNEAFGTAAKVQRENWVEQAALLAIGGVTAHATLKRSGRGQTSIWGDGPGTEATDSGLSAPALVGLRAMPRPPAGHAPAAATQSNENAVPGSDGVESSRERPAEPSEVAAPPSREIISDAPTSLSVDEAFARVAANASTGDRSAGQTAGAAPGQPGDAEARGSEDVRTSDAMRKARSAFAIVAGAEAPAEAGDPSAASISSGSTGAAGAARADQANGAPVAGTGGDARSDELRPALDPGDVAIGPGGGQSDAASLKSVRSESLVGSRNQGAGADASGAGMASAGAAGGGLRSAVPDDLKRIRGIGVVVEKKLFRMGVTSYRQIAAWTPDDIDRVSQQLDFKGRIERENWVQQARILVGSARGV